MKFKNFLKFEIGMPIIRSVEWVFNRYSLVGRAPILDNSHFKWVEELESKWPVIRKEVENLLQYHEILPNLQDIQDANYRITKDDKWKVCFLYGFGQQSELNCELCPETAAAMQKVPGMKTAVFSILSPNKHIPLHRGAYSGLLRSHLALIVPKPAGSCRIRVDDAHYQWEEGKVMVFDNSREHEAWNDSDQVRVVLLFDFLRPYPSAIRWVNTRIINVLGKMLATQGLRKQREWERKNKDKIRLQGGFIPAPNA